MKPEDRAEELFRAQYNCSQAVMGACGESEGLTLDQSLRLSSAFGGGICRTAGVCGAVTGALMALGLRHGGCTVADPSTKTRVYALGQDLMDRFRARHGSTLCRELLGCDISTPEGLAQSREQDLHNTRCVGFVRDAVALLEEIA